MKALMLLLLAMVLVGCKPTPLQTVTVVVLRCEVRKGSADCVTVVQFPDNTRRSRSGKWGEVGDEFMARKSRQTAGLWVVD